MCQWAAPLYFNQKPEKLTPQKHFYRPTRGARAYACNFLNLTIVNCTRDVKYNEDQAEANGYGQRTGGIMAVIHHRKDVDGLRAIAILSVLLFHLSPYLLPGGYTGVDIFFTISGFVIAQSIKHDIDNRCFSITDFYFKRIRRIFPAIFFVVIATTIAALVFLLPPDLTNYFKSLISTSTFISNIFFWKTSGYFAGQAELKPLLHTWSLSVEEQYYLLYPLFIYILYSVSHVSPTISIAVLILFSFVASVLALFVAPTANFFLLPTRAWELLLGALIVFWHPNIPNVKQVPHFEAWIGLAFILAGLFFLDDRSPFPGYTASLPCVGTLLIIHAGATSVYTSQTPFVNRYLALRPFVWIGAISYSLYLVHWPVAALFRYETLRDPTFYESGLLIILCIALATVSWKYIEQPFRHIDVSKRSFVFKGAAFAIIGSVSFGSIGIWTNGLPMRYPDFAERRIPGYEDWGGHACFNENPNDPTPWSETACLRINGNHGRIWLWGDSFAAHYLPGIIRSAKEINADLFQYTFAGCPPILSYYSFAIRGCSAFNKTALELIRKYKIDTVILSAKWSNVPLSTLDKLDETIQKLVDMKVRVFVIGLSPEFKADVQRLDHMLGLQHLKRGISVPLERSEVGRRLAVAARKAVLIRPKPFLCESEACLYREGNIFLYSDDEHFSSEGSLRAVRSYFPTNFASRPPIPAGEVHQLIQNGPAI